MQRYAPVIIIVASLAHSASRARGEDLGISITLIAQSTDHLVGEPVYLDAMVRNRSKRDYSACRAPLYGCEDIYTLELYIAPENKPFERFRFDPGGCAEGRRMDLKAGESWSNPVFLFYSRLGPGRLAFERPGTYSVKVVHPLMLADRPGIRYLESNAVPIRISAPAGAEADAWSRIRSREVLDFLQFGDGPHPERPAMRLVEMLEAHPTSRYREGALDALRRFSTLHLGQRLLSAEERRRFRAVLGIPESRLFAEDRRLDATIYDGPDGPADSPLPVLFEFWSVKSGATFTASPGLRQQSWSRSRETLLLRDEMEVMAECLKASWTKAGDGYSLSEDSPKTDPDAERKP